MDYSGSDHQNAIPIGNEAFAVDHYSPEEVEDTEFNRKYPPDRFGEEASDTARVWRVYRDAATEADKVELDGWNKTLDVLLIFAGLFSAVSTAFIIESYKLLQQDSTDYIAQTLFDALSAPHSSTFSLGSLNLSAPGIGFTANVSARWVNGLWFFSLVLSLSVAFLCILAKQWLDEYYARVALPAMNPRWWARKHVLFNRGLRRWGVAGFIAFLPVGLHASLFLFLAGLAIFLWQMDPSIARLPIGLGGVLLSFYIGSNILPLLNEDCPWATAAVRRVLSPLARGGLARLYEVLHRLDLYVRNTALRAFGLRGRVLKMLTALTSHLLRRLYHSPIGEDHGARLEALALRWIICKAGDQNTTIVGLHAVGGYLPSSPTVQCILEEAYISDAFIYSMYTYRPGAGYHSSHIDLSRYLRSSFCLQRADISPFNAPVAASGRDFPISLPVETTIPATYGLPFLLRAVTITYHNTGSYSYDLSADRLSHYTSTRSPDEDSPVLFSTRLQILGIVEGQISPSYLLTLLRDWPLGDNSESVLIFIRNRIREVGWLAAQDIMTHSTCLRCCFIELWCSMYLGPGDISPSHTSLVIRQLRTMLGTRWQHGSRSTECHLSSFPHTQYLAAFVLSGPFFLDATIDVNLIPGVAHSLSCMIVDPRSGPRTSLPWYPTQAQALCHLISCLRPGPSTYISLAWLSSSAAIVVGFNLTRDMMAHPVYPSDFTITAPPVTRPSSSTASAAAEWNDPFCFLRDSHGVSGATALRMLVDVFSTLDYFGTSLISFMDVLAAQLCEARRRPGNTLSDNLVHELMWPEYAATVLRPRSAYHRVIATEFDRLFLRYAQHCTELSEQIEQYSATSWWECVLQALSERISEANIEITNAYLAKMERRLRQRGKCTECPSTTRQSQLLRIRVG